jgi:hypothetical protein
MAISVHVDVSTEFLRKFKTQVEEAVSRALLSTGKGIQKEWEQQAISNFDDTPPIKVTEDRAHHGVTVEVQGRWQVVQPLNQKTGGRWLLRYSDISSVRPGFFDLPNAQARLLKRRFKRLGRGRYPLEIEYPLMRGKKRNRFGFVDYPGLRAIAAREIQREVEALR